MVHQQLLTMAAHHVTLVGNIVVRFTRNSVLVDVTRHSLMRCRKSRPLTVGLAFDQTFCEAGAAVWSAGDAAGTQRDVYVEY